MKILFVCWQNVSRSQMAAAYYNYFTHSHDADSAGTQVEMPGETLAERKVRLGGTVGIDVLREEGIDITHNKKTQVTPAMLDDYDYILSMADPSVTPQWLRDHPHYMFWPVKDPGALSMDLAREARDDIKAKVQAFITSHQEQ